MRFLLDQDVYAKTQRFLRDEGYDLVRVAALGMAQAKDEAILGAAQAQGRILITRDRDYGNLVFVRSQGAGVIYLETRDLKAVEKVRDAPSSERRGSLFTGYTRTSPLGGYLWFPMQFRRYP